ncbi:hypothetical protein [Alkalihalobacterium chitinilyticum]|uniref:DUF2651 domain-containing protein n=1 Tax=Alkalihalobacterium chitinilyticum TaxID=2980103 RepID=A0ABT5VDI7_9BACI|nr:hypothetical protein [Alkalihalobacterium chitinilyticum]MDE5413524.1 hypothetical protein [Alkalihalobacterium chitinilyticum]
MKFKPGAIITTFLPSVIMIVLSVLSFSAVHANFKGLFILSLILIFPILYALQGVACAFGKSSLLVSLLVTTLTFVLILIIYLNSSALIYILIYNISGFISYGIVKFFRSNIN